MERSIKSKLSLITAMFVFGTIGIFRRYLPFPSGMIAFSRGITGAMFLLLVILFKKQRPDIKALRKNALLLCVSGAFIGFNWILLFEAYNYTTVATATLCYYMAPIIVVIFSPLLLKEKLTVKKGICVLCALTGMIFVSGITKQGFGERGELRGVLCGLGAAALYASVMMLNQKFRDIGAYDKTIVQLLTASLVILPYTLFMENVQKNDINFKTVTVLLIIGIVHTGISYAMYFGSMENLNAQTVAIFSYIDPIVAVILSSLLLKERMGLVEIMGAVLVLGSTLVSEIDVGALFKTRAHDSRSV